MDMSARAGTRRRSPQVKLGWVAVALMFAGVAAGFLLEMLGFVFIGLGAVLLVVCLVLELRTRKAVTSEENSVFPEGGTFGGRRSPQTHEPM